jgi:uncharacterized protein (TIGR01777 family)
VGKVGVQEAGILDTRAGPEPDEFLLSWLMEGLAVLRYPVSMRILIAGGSGFLGRHLTAALSSAGHQVVVLTRQTGESRPAEPFTAGVASVAWTPDGSVGPWARACTDIDVVINLCGESIASRRWSSSQKAKLVSSRLLPTRSLVQFIDQATPRPCVFINASAIGYYGDRGNEALTEDARNGTDFLADLCCQWELEAVKARASSTRVVLVRTGIVLDPGEGALAKMLLPFKLFAGGSFGSGRQYMSWIHRSDWVSLVSWLVSAPGVEGPVNATAPNPVTNAEFARTLGHALRRPAVLPMPSFALKLALGEMAESLLLYSQRVQPTRAVAGGFQFTFTSLDAALADLLR